MLERQYGEDPQFAGRMLVQLSRQTLGEDKTRQAVDLDTRAYALGQQAHDPELMALAQCVAAYTEESAAIFDRAPARLEDASRLLATREQSNLLVQVDCDRATAQLAFRRNDTHAAESILLGAKAKLEGAGETYRKAYETVLTDLADVFNEDSRFSDAAQLMALAEETDVRYGRGGTSARLMTEQNQAVLRGNMGEIREALALIDDVRRRRRAIQGEASEPLSLILVYAGMMVKRGDAQQAVERLQAAADKAKASGNAYWYDVMLRTLCGAYLEMGDSANARSTFAQLEAALAAPTDVARAHCARQRERGQVTAGARTPVLTQRLRAGQPGGARSRRSGRADSIGLPGAAGVRDCARTRLIAWGSRVASPPKPIRPYNQ